MTEEQSKDQRINNAKAWYLRHDIDRDTWLEKTGFSIDQWNRWHSTPQGSTPTIDQVIKIYSVLDINPLFIWFGFGPEKISDIRADYEGAFQGFQEFKMQIDEIYKAIKSEEVKGKVEEIHEALKKKGWIPS